DAIIRPVSAAFGVADVRIFVLTGLLLAPVAEVAVGRALHDRLRARELGIATKSVGGREVGRADQEESELRLTQLLVEFGVAATRHFDAVAVFRLLNHLVIE